MAGPIKVSSLVSGIERRCGSIEFLLSERRVILIVTISGHSFPPILTDYRRIVLAQIPEEKAFDGNVDDQKG
jgi:hypothetical protein